MYQVNHLERVCVAIDPVMGKAVYLGDLKPVTEEVALKYIVKFNNVETEKEKDKDKEKQKENEEGNSDAAEKTGSPSASKGDREAKIASL